MLWLSLSKIYYKYLVIYFQKFWKRYENSHNVTQGVKKWPVKFLTSHALRKLLQVSIGPTIRPTNQRSSNAAFEIRKKSGVTSVTGNVYNS